MNLPEAPHIATARLDLVPLRVSHAEDMAAVLGDPALHTFIGGAPHGPRALRERYERLVAGSPDPAVRWLNWVLRLREGGGLVGTVQATVASAGQGAVAEVAWVVGVPWQGRGLAGEAAAGLVEWLARSGVREVAAFVHPEHHASAAVAVAAGLSVTGEWREGERRWLRRMDARPDGVRVNSGSQSGS
ncbi:GNAT family N-acetyltransferase [Streptomyces sp. NPDC048111]|uniref:GNAT family N-acetyltransferase n=1 Tax=Streptomyces sp. NPDC048111 TaxID=3365500 RepID=UPI0037158C35